MRSKNSVCLKPDVMRLLRV